MPHNKKILYLIPVSIALVLGSVTGYLVYGQTEPTEKIFRKDFCINEQTTLDGILYPNGEQLSYDSSGCPISIKVIHRWNELTVVEQNLIISRLVSDGYLEGEVIENGTRTVS